MSTQAKVGLVGVVLLILVVAVVWDRKESQAVDYPEIPATEPYATGYSGSEFGVTAAGSGSAYGTPGTGTAYDPALFPSATVAEQSVIYTAQGKFGGAAPIATAPGTAPAVGGATPNTPATGGAGAIAILGASPAAVTAKQSDPVDPWFDFRRFDKVDGIVARPATPAPGAPAATGTGNFASTDSSGGKYVVQEGDSFWRISKKLYGTGKYYLKLQEANKDVVPDPSRLKPGMELRVPKVDGVETASAPAPSPSSSFGSSAGGQPTLAAGSFMHRVSEGESLFSIAQRYYGKGSLYPIILNANRGAIKGESSLSVGQQLVIPPAPEGVASQR